MKKIHLFDMSICTWATIPDLFVFHHLIPTSAKLFFCLCFPDCRLAEVFHSVWSRQRGADWVGLAWPGRLGRQEVELSGYLKMNYWFICFVIKNGMGQGGGQNINTDNCSGWKRLHTTYFIEWYMAKKNCMVSYHIKWCDMIWHDIKTNHFPHC